MLAFDVDGGGVADADDGGDDDVDVPRLVAMVVEMLSLLHAAIADVAVVALEYSSCASLLWHLWELLLSLGEDVSRMAAVAVVEEQPWAATYDVKQQTGHGNGNGDVVVADDDGKQTLSMQLVCFQLPVALYTTQPPLSLMYSQLGLEMEVLWWLVVMALLFAVVAVLPQN